MYLAAAVGMPAAVKVSATRDAGYARDGRQPTQRAASGTKEPKRETVGVATKLESALPGVCSAGKGAPLLEPGSGVEEPFVCTSVLLYVVRAVVWL